MAFDLSTPLIGNNEITVPDGMGNSSASDAYWHLWAHTMGAVSLEREARVTAHVRLREAVAAPPGFSLEPNAKHGTNEAAELVLPSSFDLPLPLPEVTWGVALLVVAVALPWASAWD